jgi:hypothetical protein
VIVVVGTVVVVVGYLVVVGWLPAATLPQAVARNTNGTNLRIIMNPIRL